MSHLILYVMMFGPLVWIAVAPMKRSLAAIAETGVGRTHVN
jgi:hypothetical protein